MNCGHEDQPCCGCGDDSLNCPECDDPLCMGECCDWNNWDDFDDYEDFDNSVGQPYLSDEDYFETFEPDALLDMEMEDRLSGGDCS